MSLVVRSARPSPFGSRVLWVSGVSLVASALWMGGCSTSERPVERGASADAFEHAETGQVAQDLQVAQMVGTSLPAKTLALTFDDGPGDRAAELSMYLKSEGIKAAWFVNGAHIAASTLPNTIALTANAKGILAQIQADGHLVSNHTTTHRDLTSQVPAGQRIQELSDTDLDISAYVTSGHWLFRPPYGAWDSTVYNGLVGSAMNKYVGPVSWELGGYTNDYPNKAADYACWQGTLTVAGGAKANGTGYATTAQCGDAYLAEIENAAGPRRGIVLLHDPYFRAGQPANSTVDMVKYIVPRLKADGYTFVRVDEVPAIKTAIIASTGCDFSCTTCSGPGVAQCTNCDTGSYLSAGKCVKCSTCAAGTSVSKACTPLVNTTCAPCAAGTSAAANATTCAPCAAGTYAAAGAATCTACGKCDDGDACTTDTCDSTKGCTHVKIAGCGVDASVPVNPSADAGPGAGDIDAAVPADPAADTDSGCAVSRSTTRGAGEKGALLFGVLGLSLVLRRRVRRVVRSGFR